MNDDIQITENTPETEKRRPIAEAIWFVLFFVGFVTLVLSIIGMLFMEGSNGVQNTGGLLAVVLPIYFGIPATLLSVVQALIYRLYRFPISVMMLPAYILIIGLVLFFLFPVGTWAFRLGGDPLGLILGTPLLVGIFATVFFIKSAAIRRPSRLHISLMLLLAHVLLFALNFVLGVIACC